MAFRALRPRLMVGLGLALLAAFGVGGVIAVFMSSTPASLNHQIDSGSASRALSTLEGKLADTPSDPTLNLLAAKARLILCAQRNCVGQVSGTLPPLLQPITKLLGNVHAPVKLSDKLPPLSISAVLAQAMAKFQALTPQPQAVLALYQAVPPANQPQVAEALFQPALIQVRQGNTQSAGEQLAQLALADNIPDTYTHLASVLSGLILDNPSLSESHLIALRSSNGKPPFPATGSALIPWALLAQATNSSTITNPASVVLPNLPGLLAGWQAPTTLTDSATAAIGNELATTAHPSNTVALAQWQKGWNAGDGNLRLTLKRMSLSLNPNQPDLWAEYLPELIANAAAVSGSVPEFNLSSLSMTSLTSATSQKLGSQLMQAATKLKDKPSIAAPLITLASRLNLGQQQQIDLEKLTQDLILKATEQSNVTATLILAESQPGVAQNNRQTVVPLLVTYIRDELRTSNFTGAIKTADLLTNTLKMDIEFGPLILEEFADELKRDAIADKLAADNFDVLLEPPSQAEMDLGPLFTFMQDYFAKQPELVTAQLTTLIAEARGPYGPATAMYRLGHLFPDTMPEDKRQQWLAATLNQALINDKSLSGPDLAAATAQLAQRHPALAMAPLVENALGRATALEDQRDLWQQATPEVREVLRVIRPEFSALMRGIDAIGHHDYNSAAKEFASLTEPQWQTQAQPFIEQFHAKLAAIAGTYVPLSASGSLKTAAIQLAPAGLQGGPLQQVAVTFISRLGTLTEPNTATLSTNAAAVHSITLSVPFNFNTGTLQLTSTILAQTPHGGTFNNLFGAIRTLSLQLPKATDSATLLTAEGTPFIRATAGDDVLRPDGAFLIESRLSTATSETASILPPGAMLQLTTGASLQPAPFDTDLPAKQVYPLTGTIRHPAGTQPMPVDGYFEPLTLTATFTYSYPLPHSGQPVKAIARCQALAGPITCGAHHLHSPREMFATLSSGLQTKESLASAAAARARQNEATTDRLISLAAQAQATTTAQGLLAAPNLTEPATPSLTLALTSPSTITTATTVSSSAPPAAPPAANAAPAPTPGPQPTPAPAGPTVTSPTTPSSSTAPEVDESELDNDPAPASPKLIHTFTPSTAPTGVFIHHTDASPTTTH